MALLPNQARLPDELDRALGSAIRLRRRSLNLSQDQLGAACGISFQQIQKYENGANRISFSRLVQIARALDCHVSDLTRALDESRGAPVDFDFLNLMTLPGALELLRQYEALSAASRGLLVGFLASNLGMPLARDVEADTAGKVVCEADGAADT